MEVKRFDVFLVALDPTLGREIQKTRPCLIISPDEMNAHIGLVFIAPMTSKGSHYPTRIPSTFQRVNSQVVLDQLRTVNKRRLVKRLGRIPEATRGKVLDRLAELSAE